MDFNTIKRAVSIAATAFSFGVAIAALRSFGIIPELSTLDIAALAAVIFLIVEVIYKYYRK